MEKLKLDDIDIREVLDQLGIDYRESGKNIGHDWIGVCCPFCGDDLGYHLGIHLNSPVISCFRCGKVGNTLTYVAQEMQSYSKAIALLKQFIPKELKPNEIEESNSINTVELPKNATRIPTEPQIKYLEKRKYYWKTLHEKYNLHYCNPIGDFANRIIVPIYKQRRLVTFTSIDIANNSPLRYKHLSEKLSVCPIKDMLFGIENTNGYIACIVEGLFDQFRLGDGSICTFGATLSPNQILLLSKFSKLYIIFDGDEPGRKAAQTLSDTLGVFTDVSIVHLPEGKDPDTLSKKDIWQIKALFKK